MSKTMGFGNVFAERGFYVTYVPGHTKPVITEQVLIFTAGNTPMESRILDEPNVRKLIVELSKWVADRAAEREKANDQM